MNIEQIVTTEIYLEGEGSIEVQSVVIIESIVLFSEEEQEIVETDTGFTPMFAKLFKHPLVQAVVEATQIIAAPVFATQVFTSPLIFDADGNQTWLC